MVARGNSNSKKKPGNGKAKTEALSAKDLERLKKVLLTKRLEILHSVAQFADEALGRSRQDASGDLSSMPVHMADLASDVFEQELALGLMDGERRILQEIEDALDRMKDGTYGICEGTRKPISKARLNAQPWARYCVEYARIMEGRQA